MGAYQCGQYPFDGLAPQVIHSVTLGDDSVTFGDPEAVLAYIREFEYTYVVPTLVEDQRLQIALRRFKADVFQVLAHPTRIHIIEVLGQGEMPVGAIVEQIGVEPANASQHLALLRNKGLVTTRKDGNQVFYSLRDPLLSEVLDTMKRYFRAHLQESLAMLQGIEG